MTRDDVLKKLRAHSAELKAQGVLHAALFGSVARGDDGPDSDIDVLVDLDEALVRTIYDYVGVQHLIGDLFTQKVDVISRQTLRPSARPRVERDAIPAF